VFGPWKTATLAYATDDDLTPEVDLEDNYEYMTCLIPTIESSTVTVHVAKSSGGTFFPMYEFDDDQTGDFAHATTAATTTHAVIFRVGGCQFIKISLGTGQTADRTFYVRGFN
jgi:hypothetical protein